MKIRGPNKVLKTIEQPSAKPPARLFYLDNLRVYLAILVILHHTAMAYSGAGDWAIVDPAVDDISPIFLTSFTVVNQSYFMSAFFLLAGYFTPRSLDKKGGASFIKDRLIRLGIPLLLFTTIILNINEYLYVVYYLKESFSPIWAYSPAHLWFLQALLIFTVIYVVYRVFADRITSRRKFQYYQDRFPPDTALVLSIIILTVLTFAVRLRFPVGSCVAGLQPAHFVHYIFSFYVGIMAQRGDWFNRLTKRQARQWGIISLIVLPLGPVLMIVGGLLESEENIVQFLGGMRWQAFGYTLWETILLIGITVFLLYFFRTRFNKAGPLLRSMARNVYAVYIIHLTLLWGMNIVFLSIHIPTILKFFLVSFITISLSFLLGSLVRKVRLSQQPGLAPFSPDGGDPDQAMTTLEQALTLAEPGGFVRVFVDEGASMARLLYQALDRGIVPDFVRRLLAALPDTEPEQAESPKRPVPDTGLVEPLSEREKSSS